MQICYVSKCKNEEYVKSSINLENKVSLGQFLKFQIKGFQTTLVWLSKLF